MTRWLAWVGLLLLGTFLAAGEPPTSPMSPSQHPSAGLETLPPPRPANPPRSADPTRDSLQTELERLRAAREGLTEEQKKADQEVFQSSPDRPEKDRLRLRMTELLTGVNARYLERRSPPPTEPAGPAPAPAREPGTREETVTAAQPALPRPADPLLLALTLFRAADFSGALQTFQQLDPESLGRDDRVLVQYMTACCLRKLNKRDEAAALYREVANAREDETLTECALWHLDSLNWRRDLEKQLEEIRQRRKSIP